MTPTLRDWRESRDWARPWRDPPGFFLPGCDCCGGGGTQTLVIVSHYRYNTAAPIYGAGTVTSVPVNGAWSGEGNTNKSDNTYAVDTWDASLGTAGDQLDLTDFDFVIPDDATIDGITVSIERKKTSGTTVRDLTVQLLIAGTPSGNNKASATTYTTSDVTVSYGGAADLWGLTPTPADIIDSGFGLRFQSETTDGSGSISISVDKITVAVKYTLAAHASLTALDGSLNYLWDYDLGVNGIGGEWYAFGTLIDEDGNVYVRSESRTDNTFNAWRNQVQVDKLDKDGAHQWTWNSGDVGKSPTLPTVGSAGFTPRLCFDSDGKIIVVHKRTTTGDYFLTRLNTDGTVDIQVAYPSGSLPGSLNFDIVGPLCVDVDSSDNIFVSCGSTGNDETTIIKMDSSGNYSTHVSTSSRSMVIDRTNGNLYHWPNVTPGSAASTITIRQRAVSDLSESWSKDFDDINGTANGSTQASSPWTMLAVNEADGEVYAGAGGADGSNQLFNVYGLDSAGFNLWNQLIVPRETTYVSIVASTIKGAAFDPDGAAIYFLHDSPFSRGVFKCETTNGNVTLNKFQTGGTGQIAVSALTFSA